MLLRSCHCLQREFVPTMGGQFWNSATRIYTVAHVQGNGTVEGSSPVAVEEPQSRDLTMGCKGGTTWIETLARPNTPPCSHGPANPITMDSEFLPGIAG